MENLIFNPQKPGPKRAFILFVLPAILSMIFLYVFMKSWTVVFFFLTVWFSIMIILWGTYSKKVSVRLDGEGIHLRVNGIGLVPWEYVSGFKMMKGPNGRLIALTMDDAEEFIESKGRLTRAIMRSNLQVGSPVLIPETEFNIPLEEALEGMSAYQEMLDGE